jgi:hypothetical protein
MSPEQVEEFETFLSSPSSASAEKNAPVSVRDHCIFLRDEGKDAVVRSLAKGGVAIFASATQSRKCGLIPVVSEYCHIVGSPVVHFVDVNHAGVQEVVQKVTNISPKVAVEDAAGMEDAEDAEDAEDVLAGEQIAADLAALHPAGGTEVFYHYMNGQKPRWDLLRRERHGLDRIRRGNVRLVMSCHADTVDKFSKYITECAPYPSP